MISPPQGPDPAHEPGGGSLTHARTRVAAGHAGAPREPGQSSAVITPAFVLRALRRWWKIASPIGLLLGTVAALYMYFSFVPAYRASAWLRIQENPDYVIHRESGSSTRTFVQTQAQLIKSPLVLEQVLAQREIAQSPSLVEHPSPITFLTARVRVTARPDSELFVVGFDGPEPRETALIVNSVVEAYFKVHSQDEQLQAQRVIELLEDERERRRVLVQGLRANIRELKKSTLGNKVDKNVMADETTLKVPLADLHRRITTAEVAQELLQAKLKAFEETVETGVIEIPPAEINAELERNMHLKDLREASRKRRAEISNFLKVSTRGEQDPRYQEMARELNNLERAIDEETEKLRRAITENKVQEQLKAQADKLKSWRKRVDDRQLEIDLLRKRYFAEREELVKATGPTMDLTFKVAELRREERVFAMIAARIMRLRTEMRRPARVTLLKKASPPSMANSRVSSKKVAFAALLSFLFPFGLAVAWERLVCRVDGPQQLWQADLAVVGEIAKLPVTTRGITPGANAAFGRDVSLFEESIDSLRTCLVLSHPTSESRILVVSSAVSGEGKTSVASQLAVSIARSSGETTLLIDADMRSPDIHNVFDIPNEPGLAQLLGHECTLDQSIVTTWSNYVHLMPAGVLKVSPHKLLGNGALRPLLQELRSRYKHIIIDTSPILSASESLVLAKSADATLLCAMRDLSRVDQVQRAYERLLNTGARPLGTVLNGVPTNRYAYLYGVYAYSRG